MSDEVTSSPIYMFPDRATIRRLVDSGTSRGGVNSGTGSRRDEHGDPEQDVPCRLIDDMAKLYPGAASISTTAEVGVRFMRDVGLKAGDILEVKMPGLDTSRRMLRVVGFSKKGYNPITTAGLLYWLAECEEVE